MFINWIAPFTKIIYSFREIVQTVCTYLCQPAMLGGKRKNRKEKKKGSTMKKLFMWGSYVFPASLPPHECFCQVMATPVLKLLERIIFNHTAPTFLSLSSISFTIMKEVFPSQKWKLLTLTSSVLSKKYDIPCDNSSRTSGHLTQKLGLKKTKLHRRRR